MIRRRFIASEECKNELYDFLMSSDSLISDERACYVYGYGSHPKSTYRKLKEEENNQYEVLWFGFNGPPKFKLISRFVASSSGLICLKNTEVIPSILEVLSKLSMVGLFSLSRSHSDEFVNNISPDTRSGEWKTIEEYVKGDSSLFYVILDGDTYDLDAGGFLSEMAFGDNCPDNLYGLTSIIKSEW